jgi:hypothetical protein
MVILFIEREFSKERGADEYSAADLLEPLISYPSPLDVL